MTEQTPGVADHAAPTDVPLILREPVRLYLYGLTVPVVALLVGLGLVNSSTALLISAVAAALFSVPVTEATRRAVVSPAVAADVARLTALEASTSATLQPAGDRETRTHRALITARAQADSAGVPGTGNTLPLAA